jgi:hypothetical protein
MRQPSVCTFKFSVTGVPVNTQHFIIILGHNVLYLRKNNLVRLGNTLLSQTLRSK